MFASRTALLAEFGCGAGAGAVWIGAGWGAGGWIDACWTGADDGRIGVIRREGHSVALLLP